MLRMYDFRCEEGHVQEVLIRDDTREITCGECGLPAIRQIPAPRSRLDGTSGDFPTAADAWENRRKSHMKKEQKALESHGTYWDMYRRS